MTRPEIKKPTMPVVTAVAQVASATSTTIVVESVEDITGTSDHAEATSSDETAIKSDDENRDAVDKQELSSVVSYHQDAELYLEVRDSTGTPIQCKVVSALIVAASPKLSDLLDRFKPNKTTDGKLVVQLTDPTDNFYGLDVLLSIIHYKFHEIPERPDVDQLYCIARVVEKYDCAHLLVPYMEKWVAGLDWHLVMKSEVNDDDKALFLTWVIGEGRWFSRMLSKTARKATLADDGSLLDASGQPWDDHGLPTDILELLKETRNDFLATIVRAVDDPLRELMRGDKESTNYCRAKDADAELKQSCQHLQLGSLMTSLATTKLLPFPTTKTYKGSVAVLAERVRAIKVARFKLPGTPPHLDSHCNCGVDYEEMIDSAMREKIQLPADIINQLKFHARKSGAFRPELFQDIEGPNGHETGLEPILKELRLSPVLFKQVFDLRSRLESSNEDNAANTTSECEEA
ncbi:predicted protein [Chaetomium globosum CBS 148.51]|uniref:BTB domain-containing protein n=1 Tax=Chaetomium globosum (strain ATCC 6205 / CBS 148.51 / DSM 1962 / NBRC 6347 / NRRL 1970) TaxID=306901 RepID=Q2GTE2_CHAGB|nr:uncharacterized protein CHGG_08762 [Chaetomium globosum CBS 148.51]EAQ84748.1 predicted protein [Chaetomium globosum CBS 148.51]